MTVQKPHDELLSTDQKQIAINEIIDFFSTQRDQEIGIIAAGDILDLFLQTSAISIYNKGVEDAQKIVKEKLTELDAQIELTLKK